MHSPGTLLQDRYKIIRYIARGGQGEVYEAWDSRLEIAVAVKQTCVDEEWAQELLQKEGRLLASLHHRALPQVIDCFIEQDSAFLVMKFIPGDDLYQLIKKNGGPLPADLVLGWAYQLLDALDYLHTQDPAIIHRDVKPKNIKLTEDGYIFLLDFGIAKLMVSGRTPFYGPGTLSYAPLEQLQDSGTDVRSDLHSMAATLYYLLTGVEPTGAVARAKAIHSGGTDPLRPANEVNPEVSARLAQVLMRAMSLNREDRPHSAAAMQRELRNAASLAGLVRRYLIDGSNVCRYSQTTPSLVVLFTLLIELRRRGETFLCIFDANIWHVFNNSGASNDAQIYKEFSSSLQDFFSEVPGRTQADDYLLMLADSSGDSIISNDQYRQYIAKYPWIASVPGRLIKGMVAGKTLVIPPLNIDIPINRTSEDLWRELKSIIKGDSLPIKPVEQTGPTAVLDKVKSEISVRVDEGFQIKTAKSRVQNQPNWVPVVQHSLRDCQAVAYSAQNDLVAAGGRDGLITIFREQDGTELRVIEAHHAVIWSLDFSPDGKVIASAGEDNSIRLWDLNTGSLIFTMLGHEETVGSINFSPKEDLLASGSGDKTVRLWNTVTGRQERIVGQLRSGIYCVCFSPNGDMLATSAYSGWIQLWDLKSNRMLWNQKACEDDSCIIAFAPDGQFIASGNDSSDFIKIWEVQSGNHIRDLKAQEGGISSLKFSLGGKALASGEKYSDSIALWDIQTGRLLNTIETDYLSAGLVSVSASGNKLFTASSLGAFLYEAKTGKQLWGIESYGKQISSMDVSLDGELLAFSGWHYINLLNIKNNKKLQILRDDRHEVESISCSPNGDLLASIGKQGYEADNVFLWDTKTGKNTRILEEPGIITNKSHLPDTLKFSPDGQLLAGVLGEKKVYLWDVYTGKRFNILEGHTSYVKCVTFSSDSKILASGGWDRTIRLWEIRTGNQLRVLEGYEYPVYSTIFTPRVEILAGAIGDSTVRLWEVKTGKPLNVLTGHQAIIWSLSLSPDGIVLASASQDHTVRLWDIERGDCLAVLEGHLGPAHVVRFAPNGKCLIVAGENGRIEFWDFNKFEPVLYRYDLKDDGWLYLLPDGRFNADLKGRNFLSYIAHNSLRLSRVEEVAKEFYDPDAVSEVIERYLE